MSDCPQHRTPNREFSRNATAYRLQQKSATTPPILRKVFQGLTLLCYTARSSRDPSRCRSHTLSLHPEFDLCALSFLIPACTSHQTPRSATPAAVKLPLMSCRPASAKQICSSAKAIWGSRESSATNSSVWHGPESSPAGELSEKSTAPATTETPAVAA